MLLKFSFAMRKKILYYYSVLPRLFVLLLIPLVFVTVHSSFASAEKSSEVQVGKKNKRENVVPGEFIIKMKNDTSPDDLFLGKNKLESTKKIVDKDKIKEKKLEKVKKAGIDKWYKAKARSGNSEKALQLLRRDPNVEYAEPNYIYSVSLTPNDPFFPQLWSLNSNSQPGGIDIDAPLAWDTRTASDVVVGVIDTGIDYNHEDLVANMWTNPGETAGNNIDDDGNGFVDDIHGWDFVNNDNDPADDYGHGTHVAGTIGAVGNNGVGVTGVAWNIKIASLKFIGSSGYGTLEDAVRALTYAEMMGFAITNNSWAGGGYSQALYDAISAANSNGHLFVAAAGNSSQNMDSVPDYPAGYNLDNIISVAATDSSDGMAYFSNYGAMSVDLGAPGVFVYSTVPKGMCILCSPSGYSYLSGTSMASPHVAGVAALLWTQRPTLSNLGVKNAILAGTDPVPSLFGKTVSGGRLNLYNLFDNDSTPPNAITNLSVIDKTFNTITLQWTAVGDDGAIGRAKKYDVRYSTSPITNINFANAQKAGIVPPPSVSGTLESVIVKGLSPNTTYYFAVKVSDNVSNTSGISNIATGKTSTADIFFSDAVPSDTTNWTIEGDNGMGGGALWHVTTRRSQSPTRSLYYGSETTGNFNTGAANKGSVISPSINLSASKNSQLSFQQFLDKEAGLSYDKTQIFVSEDNGTSWVEIFFGTPTEGVWKNEVLDLSAYDGKTIKIKFSFDTIDAVLNDFEGWFLDDIVVRGQKISVPPVADAGPDQNGATGQSLNFSGAASTDLDGTITSYIWNFGDGATASGKMVSHAYSNAGTYLVKLKVQDNVGLVDEDELSVTVVSVPTMVFSDSFEIKEWNNLWTEDSQNDWSRARQRGVGSKYSAEIDGSANDAQLISIPINLGTKKNAEISFSWYIENTFDAGEYVAFDVSTDNGATWVEKSRIRGDVDPENKWAQVNLVLTNINNLKIRFRGKVSSSTEDANVDAVTVTAY